MYLTDGIGLDKSPSAPPFPLSKPRAPQIFWRKREECFVLTGEPKKGLALRAQASFLGDKFILIQPLRTTQYIGLHYG